MSFSGKNDAKSFRNFIENSVLDSKRAKLVQKSLRKVDGKLTLFPRPVQEDPYGPIYGPIWAPTRTGPQPGLDFFWNRFLFHETLYMFDLFNVVFDLQKNYPSVTLTRNCLPPGWEFHKFIFQVCIPGLHSTLYIPDFIFRALYSRFYIPCLIFQVLYSRFILQLGNWAPEAGGTLLRLGEAS